MQVEPGSLPETSELGPLDYLLARTAQLQELKRVDEKLYHRFVEEFEKVAKTKRGKPAAEMRFKVFQHIIALIVVGGGLWIAKSMVEKGNSSSAVGLIVGMDVLVATFLGVAIYQVAKSTRSDDSATRKK